MKKPKQRIIFDNYDGYSDEYIREWLKEEHSWQYPDDNDWEPTEQEISSERSFQEEVGWEDFQYEFEEFIKGNTFILQGDIGTWRGKQRGGFTFETFNELSRCWSNCDYIKLYDENGHLYVKCSHHDGTNFYEIRMLNQKGIDYLNNNYSFCDEEVHNKLMNNPYSVLPEYAHKVFGCKKREYESEAV